MSKFEQLLNEDLLDLKNFKIREKPMPNGFRVTDPDRPLMQCIVPVKEYDIPAEAKKVFKAALRYTSGQLSDLGIGGFMSNQKDGLAKTEIKPEENIRLKQPTTQIVAQGMVWVCTDFELSKRGFFVLTPEMCKRQIGEAVEIREEARKAKEA